MQFWLIPVLGLAPGLFWLWLVSKGNKYRPEPKRLIIRTFLLGMAIVIPVAFIELALEMPYLISHLREFQSSSTDIFNHLSLGESAYMAFIVAGFTEELFKFLVVRTTIYKSPYFDEPVDGLVYSSAAALGFSTLENISYMFEFGWSVILVRAPISTVAHVAFSALWGYPLALKKLNKKNATLFLWLGLIGAMAGHGLFDFLAFQQENTQPTIMNILLLIASIVLFGGLIAVFVILLKRGQKISPYKDKNADLLMSCPNCRAHIPYYSDFCTFCGARLAKNKAGYPEFCGQCGSELANGMNFCPSCGSQLIKKPGIVNERRR
jgi:RsiW-degrading membrane proteinase PrsW (M82 family)/RNA polymerase subunit RPABC4/transcription elongation factor Spt4